MKLSVVIPAHNEEGNLVKTVTDLLQALQEEKIDHEILVVNDNSSDNTETILQELSTTHSTIRYVNNESENGFGMAVRCGLVNFTGDAVAVYMADASDSPKDLVTYYRTMITDKVDCVFGTRFSKKSKVYDYPKIKLFLNRGFNLFIQLVFGLRYNDVTNAFKLYSRSAIEGVQPYLSHHFNLTVELPLKAIVRGYTYSIVPNDWTNRTEGVSKLKLKEMGSRYLFIVLYCLIEKWLSRGDYKK